MVTSTSRLWQSKEAIFSENESYASMNRILPVTKFRDIFEAVRFKDIWMSAKQCCLSQEDKSKYKRVSFETTFIPHAFFTEVEGPCNLQLNKRFGSHIGYVISHPCANPTQMMDVSA
jgi:hypothetical protein